MDSIKFETLQVYYQVDGFIPFTGPIAERIKKRVQEMSDISDLSDELIDAAVKSLCAISESDITTMFSVQDEFCEKCGNCCRICNPIVVTKEELKTIAHYLRIPYKKLKKRYRIVPRVKGEFNLPAKPCPFLEGKNHCKIYEIRPSVCIHHPTGYAMASLLEGQGLMVPEGCPSVEKMLANTVMVRIIQEHLHTENPELLEKIKQVSESIYKDINGKPTAERIVSYIQITRELRKKTADILKKKKT